MPVNIQWKPGVAAFVLGTSSLIAMAAQTGKEAGTPLRVASQFCGNYNDRSLDQRYGSMVSISLNKAIQKAKRTDRIFSRRHPGNKPPLGDGLPFQSVSDRGTCQPGTVRKTRGRVLAAISYHLGDGVLLHDRLVMVQEKGRWKIDDILFGPLHADGMRKTLRAIADQK